MRLGNCLISRIKCGGDWPRVVQPAEDCGKFKEYFHRALICLIVD